MFHLGIDVSKKSCHYFLVNPEGKKVKSFSLDNTHEAFQHLLKRLEDQGSYQPKVSPIFTLFLAHE